MRHFYSRYWFNIPLLVWLSMMYAAAGCTFLDIRPQNLRGVVTCTVVTDTTSQPLQVRVVLDESAIRQHSRFEIIRGIHESSANNTAQLLAVDIGSAMGAIDGCGTFENRKIEMRITDQMISYPSWIRIETRPEDSVVLRIEDELGNLVVAQFVLPPNQIVLMHSGSVRYIAYLHLHTQHLFAVGE